MTAPVSWHPSTLIEAPARPSQQLKSFVDELLDEFPHMGAAAAAEAAADRLGFYYERRKKLRRGWRAVEVALEGQRPRSGWRRAACLGAQGLWKSGGWITISDAYRSGSGGVEDRWPVEHEIGYR
jgi:hypothetical protein